MQPQGTYLDQYKIIRTLGSGYHATVLLGETKDNTQVAIKRFKPQTANLQTLKHQLSIMKQLNHPNLVKLIDVRENAIFKKPDGESYNCFAIIIQYISGGELFDYIAIAGRFNETLTRTYFFQLLNALNYMHEKGFAHRDIKPQNIMLTKDYVLKLADYGFSTVLEGKDKSGVLHTKLGTEGYMAPQISTKAYDGTKVDIFACGVILFIMFSANPPFERASPNDPYYKLIKQKDFKRFWLVHGKRKPLNFYKPDFKVLVEAMLAYNPAQRPTLKQICEDFEWTKGQVAQIQSVKTEFDERKKKIDTQLQKQRAQKQKRREDRQQALLKTGEVKREQNSDIEAFVQNYQKQQCKKTSLETKKHIENCDIIVKQSEDFVISSLATFLSQPVVFKQGDTVIQQYTPKYKRQGNKFIVTYTFENDNKQIETVSLSLTVSKDKQGHVIITPKKIDGHCIHMKRLKKMLDHQFCYCKVTK